MRWLSVSGSEKTAISRIASMEGSFCTSKPGIPALPLTKQQTWLIDCSLAFEWEPASRSR